MTSSAAPSPKKDTEKAPTVLAALTKSTRDERAASPEKATELAKDLHGIMMGWTRHWEAYYLAADERWDFYDGRHWGYMSPTLGMRIVEPQTRPDAKRKTYNYIRLDVERQVSILMKDRPVIKAYAGANEIMDEAASEAADDLIDWRQQRTNLCSDAERVARNSGIAGWCWAHLEWDDTLGRLVQRTGDDGQPVMRPVVDPEGGMMLDPATNQPMEEPDMAPEGDYAREILSHRQGVPDPAAKTIFGGSGFFIRKKVSRFDFKRRFKHLDIGDFPADGSADLNKAVTNMSGPGWRKGDGGDKDELEVVIFYAPKCDDYPKGCRVVFTETALVEEVDNPRYPTDEEMEKGESEPNPNEEPCWPVGTFVFGLHEGTPLGFSPVADAIGPNKAINGLGTTALMHAALMKGKWKVPNDLGQELTDETSQIIKVSPRRFDPNTLGAILPPAMPSEYMTLWNAHVEALHGFMWLNQPAVGSQESAGDSGYKVRLQQQVADNNLEKVRERQNDMWAWAYEYELFLWRRHATERRSILVIGENRAAELRELDRTAIMPGTNVRCAHNSFMPRDPAMKMAWFQQFMGTGVMQLPDVQRQKMFEWIGAQNTEIFIDSERADVQRAKRQFLRIMNDEEPGAVSDQDDHTVQLDVLRKAYLSQAFETKVKAELKASQAQPPMQSVDPMTGMPSIVPSQPTSQAYTRMRGLIDAHKAALVEQTKLQMGGMAPPAPGGAMTAPPPAESAPSAPSQAAA